MSDDTLKRLSDPFDPEDVEWRVQQSGVSGGGKPWVMVIAYITSRAIQKRFDDVFGIEHWKNEFRPTPDGNGWLCGISAKINGEWITKWDGAECTDIEPLKGGLSGATKRAAVQWGVGRYLYSLDVEFAPCQPCENRYQATGHFISIKTKNSNVRVGAEWFAPSLPDWALPSFESDQILESIGKAEDMEALKRAWESARSYSSNFKREDLHSKFLAAVNERKAGIVERQQEESQANYSKIERWLDEQLDNLIRGAANESSLKSSYSSVKKQLHEKTAGEARQLLTQHLDQVKEAREQQLKGDKNA